MTGDLNQAKLQVVTSFEFKTSY